MHETALGPARASETPHSPMVSSLFTEAELQHMINTAPMPIIVPAYCLRLTSRNPGKPAQFAGETVEQLEGPRMVTALHTKADLFDGHAEEHDDDKDVTDILAVGASLLRILADCAFMPQFSAGHVAANTTVHGDAPPRTVDATPGTVTQPPRTVDATPYTASHRARSPSRAMVNTMNCVTVSCVAMTTTCLKKTLTKKNFLMKTFPKKNLLKTNLLKHNFSPKNVLHIRRKSRRSRRRRPRSPATMQSGCHGRVV